MSSYSSQNSTQPSSSALGSSVTGRSGVACENPLTHFLELLLDQPIHQTTDEWVYLISVDPRFAAHSFTSSRVTDRVYKRGPFRTTTHQSSRISFQNRKSTTEDEVSSDHISWSAGTQSIYQPSPWPQDQLSEMEEYFVESQGLAATLVSFPLISLYSAYVLLA